MEAALCVICDFALKEMFRIISRQFMDLIISSYFTAISTDYVINNNGKEK